MGFRSAIIKPIAKAIARKIDRMADKAIVHQEAIFKTLIQKAKKTAFGRDHHFDQIHAHADFVKYVPVVDYEDLKSYIERVKKGELSVLWPGKPRFFAKTSGTTSGVKYIPMSHASTPHHFSTARDAVFNYFARTGNGAWLDGKVIFLSGSPELDKINGILTGRLSGISNHLVPAWLRTNQLPTWETNCIEDWEQKLDKIIGETAHQDMRLISGIPPWVQMYYERLLETTGKANIREIFPNYSVFVYGGVNFEPYRARLEALTGGPIDSVETYPASEGFIAFQDRFPSEGLLLNTNAGIFFEFIPADAYYSENPPRLWLKDVQLGVNYVLIINSNAGLWGYNIGDTVQFVSLQPYRLLVTGRIKHFISAFGEHVIGKEVEESILQVAEKQGVRITEFTVAPQVNPPEGGLPYHEWFVEFDQAPTDLEAFAKMVDDALSQQNIYYRDLIEGKILRVLKIRPLQRDAFRQYMKSEGKLGGQNKPPRLTNDRKMADFLTPLAQG